MLSSEFALDEQNGKMMPGRIKLYLDARALMSVLERVFMCTCFDEQINGNGHNTVRKSEPCEHMHLFIHICHYHISHVSHSFLALSWFFFFFFILYGFSPVEFVFAFEVTQWIYFWPEKSYINVFSFGFHLCGVQKLFFNLIIMHFQLKFLSHINSLCRIPVWKEYSMGYSRICWF